MAKSAGRLRTSPRAVLVNAAAATVIVDFAKFTSVRGNLSSLAPIDEYYENVTELVRTTSESSTTERIQRLLVVELVSCVERYIRSLLVHLIATCPYSQQVAERKQVTIASVRYYQAQELAFAILDHQALSGQNEIIKATIQLLGIDIRPGSSVYVALAEFERVCQLRHAIVHQGGRLGPNNLLELQVEMTTPLVVSIDALAFQDLVAICHAAVRAYNQYIFEATIERWAKEGQLIGNWTQDKSLFEKLWALLSSAFDRGTSVPADEYKKILDLQVQ